MSMDKTDNMTEDMDLLEILSNADTEDLNEAISKSDEDKEEDMALQRIKDIEVDVEAVQTNPGCGDIHQDLANWFCGTDKIPSDPINNYVSNNSLKMDYGLTHSTLSNIELSGKLYKFINNNFDMMFDDSTMLALTPDEQMDRMKTAFTMYKELANINQRTIMSLKEFKFKSNSNNDNIDRLSQLLSSIPSDKLKKLLEEINKG